MTGFVYNVNVDGSNIAPIVLEGATLTFGRETVLEQPRSPVAVLEILTRDAYPDAAEDYPEFGLGDWASDLSGFTDTYVDEYEGVTSRLTIGVPVYVDASTGSGFTDTYEDSYNGANLRRFTGKVQAITYTPGSIQLTCTPKTEQWGSISVGGTKANTTIPVEYDRERLIRLAAEAGIELIVDGPNSVQVTAVAKKTPPRPLFEWLTNIARDCQGVVYTDRYEFIHVETRDYVPPYIPPIVDLPPGATLLDPLKMYLELGAIRNRVTVEYGAEDANGDRPTVTSEDAESIARYGLRDLNYATIIQNQADAQTFANWVNTELSPQWSLPDAVVALSLLDGAQTYEILTVEMGHRIRLPQLLPGSPTQTYEATVLGYTETLSANDWRISFHLSPLFDKGGAL